MNPLVTVIIPTYNRAKFLREAVESILAQTLKDWEAIVIDDGSSDGTESMMREYAQKDLRIRYLRQNQGGVSKARNRGLALSRGKYVAFLDDDDLFMTEKLKVQTDYLETHPDAGFVYSQAEIINPDGSLQAIEPERPVANFRELFEKCNVRIQTVMCRKEVLDKVGYFDESLTIGEDYDLWLRLARQMGFHFISRPLVKFRIHGTNTCNAFVSLYRQRREVLNRVSVNESLGITKEVKAKRLAVNDYRLARIYREAGQYKQAAACFWRAVRAYPAIGLEMAGEENQKSKVLLYLKPYLAAGYLWFRGFSASNKRANDQKNAPR